MAYLTGKRIAAPLESACKELDRISSGDLSKDIPVHGLETKDEIGIMFRAMTSMNSSLRNFLGSVSKSVQTVAAPTQVATVNDLARSSGQLSKATQEIAKNVSESAQGLGEVTKTIAGVSHEAADTASGIAHVKDRADELAQLSENLKSLLGQCKIE